MHSVVVVHGSATPTALLALIPKKELLRYEQGRMVYREGEVADAMFYIESGRLKIARVSNTGREAVITLLAPGDFAGEACLIGYHRRLSSAICMSHCRLWRIRNEEVLSLLHQNGQFADSFVHYLVSRTARYQEDLADQLLNRTEKRLARALLLLAHFGSNDHIVARTISAITHETLAEMIGTTRARVSHFMNRFRQAGFLTYDRRQICVHPDLIQVLLHD
jgi:CRP/FNR family transcriptional regulator, cyclic AMP receptor protein